MHRILYLVGALALALQTQAAFAATASASSYQIRDDGSGPGFATASVSNTYAYVNANAYEYRGGVGVFAFSGTSSVASRVVNTAMAEASFSESIRVGRSGNPAFQLVGIGDNTLFELSWSVRPSGSLSTSTAVYSGNTTSVASASYDYDWSFAGAGGSGRRFESDQATTPVTTGGHESPLTGTAYVRLGDVVTLDIHAKAYAATLALPNTPASASAQFDHTLKWGGISGIRAFDGQGVEIELPDGFELALMSDDGGFDYFNAAGSNPYLTPAPEPGEWAMLVAGLGAVRLAARRRAGSRADRG